MPQETTLQPPVRPTGIDPALRARLEAEYIRAIHAAGCPREQIQNFTRAGLALQPKQLKFAAAARACDRPDGPFEIGFGGARGGGKSYVLLAQAGADDCQRFPGLKVLLLRKVGKANLEHFQDLRLRLFSSLEHTFTNRGGGQLTFANGSKIFAGHFQHERDIDTYLGLEYDLILIEEATTLTSGKIRDITTTCRTSKDGWRARIYYSTNPGGVGHAHFRAKFILPFRAGRETTTRFIPSTVDDNRFIRRDYVRVLDGLVGWKHRAWRLGDWDIAAGQYFTTFRQDVHVVTGDQDKRVLGWRGSLDWGRKHFTVALLGGEDSDGNEWILDEHAAAELLPSQQAAHIHVAIARHKTPAGALLTRANLGSFVAGTDVFADDPTSGTSVAKQFDAAGIPLTPANTERVNGWSAILERLGDQDRGIRPRLFIHERCKLLLEQLPLMQHDPKHPEDVLKVDVDEEGEGGDDAADALRYFVASAPGRVEMRKLRG